MSQLRNAKQVKLYEHTKVMAEKEHLKYMQKSKHRIDFRKFCNWLIIEAIKRGVL